MSADLGGEQNYRNREFDLEFNANRTTDAVEDHARDAEQLLR